MDTYIYYEFCIEKGAIKHDINSTNLHYKLNNMVPHNFTLIRQLTNRKCKITNYFTHQAKKLVGNKNYLK